MARKSNWTFGENKPNQSQFSSPQRGRTEVRCRMPELRLRWTTERMNEGRWTVDDGRYKMELNFICAFSLGLVKYDFQMAKLLSNSIDIDKWLNLIRADGIGPTTFARVTAPGQSYNIWKIDRVARSVYDTGGYF